MFMAVALSTPVNMLNRYMKRGFAIGLVYLALFGAVALLVALLVPPIVNEGNDLADNAPSYVQDVRDTSRRTSACARSTTTTRSPTSWRRRRKLPRSIGGAAGVLRDIGFGIVNGIFAFVTILVLTAFMLSGGPEWRAARWGLPPDRAERIDRSWTTWRAPSAGMSRSLVIALIAGTRDVHRLTVLGAGSPRRCLVAGLSAGPLVAARLLPC